MADHSIQIDDMWMNVRKVDRRNGKMGVHEDGAVEVDDHDNGEDGRHRANSPHYGDDLVYSLCHPRS